MRHVSVVTLSAEKSVLASKFIHLILQQEFEMNYLVLRGIRTSYQPTEPNDVYSF